MSRRSYYYVFIATLVCTGLLFVGWQLYSVRRDATSTPIQRRPSKGSEANGNKELTKSGPALNATLQARPTSEASPARPTLGVPEHMSEAPASDDPRTLPDRPMELPPASAPLESPSSSRHMLEAVTPDALRALPDLPEAENPFRRLTTDQLQRSLDLAMEYQDARQNLQVSYGRDEISNDEFLARLAEVDALFENKAQALTEAWFEPAEARSLNEAAQRYISALMQRVLAGESLEDDTR